VVVLIDNDETDEQLYQHIIIYLNETILQEYEVDERHEVDNDEIENLQFFYEYLLLDELVELIVVIDLEIEHDIYTDDALIDNNEFVLI